MITSPGIKDAINDPENISDMYTYIEKGKRGTGTQSFDQHITDLYRNKMITIEEAKAAATSPEDFERNLMFGDQEEDEESSQDFLE